MRKAAWRKIHKVSGIILGFFMLMCCLSGIVLNHRQVFGDIDVSRGCLPPWYRFEKWNGGLMRGTLPLPPELSPTGDDSCVLVYGSGGMMVADGTGKNFTGFNRGIPQEAERRQIRSVVRCADGRMYALSSFALYRYDPSTGWRDAGLMADDGERFSDMTCRGDTVVVAGRSFLYVSDGAGDDFRKIRLKAPDGYEPQTSLFTTVWKLHSGELFGLPGRLAVDAVALVLAMLCVTGLVIWLFPHIRGVVGIAVKLKVANLRLHNRMGVVTIFFTCFVVLTGWCLRPPLMLPLAMTKTAPLPGTPESGDNPWHDRIRMIRHDDAHGDWLLSASDGFYSLSELDATPSRLSGTPPVSVMGLNVWTPGAGGEWICGSFAGLFVWNRAEGHSVDSYTGEPASDKAGPPVGRHAVAGYSTDFGAQPVVALYDGGTDLLPQPAEYACLPMSLWQVALEVHSGRIYFGAAATWFFIFLFGGGALLLLWSGWKIRISRRHKSGH